MDTFGSYALTLKLALATSIIRSKPPNSSIKDYIQQLSLKLRKNEELWKSKVTKLEHELEKKSCEIVMLKLKTGGNESTSQEINRGLQDRVQQNDIYSQSMQDNFLRSVISIENWYDLLMTEDIPSLNAIKSAVISSLQDLDHSLSKGFRNSYGFELIMKNMRTLTELLKKDSFSSDEKIVECCGSVVKRILLTMFNSNLQNLSCQNLQEAMLLIAQTGGHIAHVVIESLILIIVGYSGLLKDMKELSSLDELKYEKMFFICKLLNAVISSCPHDSEFREQCLEKLMELDLLSIGYVFPVYSHCIWVIISMLSDMGSGQSALEQSRLWKNE